MEDCTVHVYQCGHIEILEKIVAETLAPTSVAVKSHTKHNSKFSPEFISTGHTTWLSYFSISKDFWATKQCPEYFCNECNTKHSRKHAYRFQREGVSFVESNRCAALIADAMGLGKTIQALLTLRKHTVIMQPTLILVKGSTIFQWANEYGEWITGELGSVLPVTDRIHFIKGFSTYIVSIDLISRRGVVEAINKLGIKSVIIDEVQNFKDSSSKRTKALIRIIQENQVEYRIALSGTPIKNRASEYFTVLNLLDPATFYSEIAFKRSWLIPNERGVYTKINPYKLDAFKEVTSKYILRREKHEVLKNLPDLLRDYQYIKIEDKQVCDSYNRTVDLFKNFLQNNAKIDSTEILGWLAKLRAITGAAKAKAAVEWTADFLDATDDSLAIGIHHRGVRDMLYYTFSEANISTLKLSGEDDSYAKNRIANDFNSGRARILILNALAGGVGLNLQSCANALLLERQWNPADEEQFISRFHRDGQKQSVTVTYMIAKGTIDEFFHDLVIKKSQISSQIGIKIAPYSENLMSDAEFLREFAEYVSSNKI
jgi:SNF2 family DNA or RNA helicase